MQDLTTLTSKMAKPEMRHCRIWPPSTPKAGTEPLDLGVGGPLGEVAGGEVRGDGGLLHPFPQAPVG